MAVIMVVIVITIIVVNIIISVYYHSQVFHENKTSIKAVIVGNRLLYLTGYISFMAAS